MPALGADMEAGILAEWLVKPGDTVESGNVVCVVETQKGAIEVEIFETGTIAELLVHVGEEVPVGAPLARLGDGAANGEPPPAPAPVLAGGGARAAAPRAGTRPTPKADCPGRRLRSGRARRSVLPPDARARASLHLDPGEPCWNRHRRLGHSGRR